MPGTMRYEIKYRVSPERAAAVRRYVRQLMQPDEYSTGAVPTYAVHSLYLDGADWSIYTDTLNGNFSRFKLRARTYSFAADAPWFLEVKSRAGEAMFKTRARVSRDEARQLLWGEARSQRALSEGLEHFRSQLLQRDAFPREWVTYKREAYVGGHRDLVRVTFDTEIACAPVTADLAEPERWVVVPESRDEVILEVKYSGSYPAWVADMIRRFGLQRGSMSKYRHAVETLYQPQSGAGVSRAGLMGSRFALAG
jgi:SPX domain protein involved in polyphosphate accumulation